MKPTKHQANIHNHTAMAYSCCYFGFFLLDFFFPNAEHIPGIATLLLTHFFDVMEIFEFLCEIIEDILIINCKWKRCPTNSPYRSDKRIDKQITVEMYRKCVVIPCFYHRSLQIQTIKTAEENMRFFFLLLSFLAPHRMIENSVRLTNI